MNFNLILRVFFLIILITPFTSQAGYKYITFDKSMYVLNKNDLKKQSSDYELFSNLYIKNNPQSSNCKTNSIPKIIHQIWIGPRPLPKIYLPLIASWKRDYPDWQYKLWMDKDVEKFQFKTKDLYHKASSYQEKADILRYEILNKYGGLYVDMDYESIRPMSDILNKYNFIASIEPPFKNQIIVTNAILASKPHNVILVNTLNKIRQHWHDVEISFREELKTRSLKKILIHLAVNRTMSPLKTSILKNLDEECILILPPTYLGLHKRNKFFDKFRRLLKLESKNLFFRTLQTETYARQHKGLTRHVDDIMNISSKKH